MTASSPRAAVISGSPKKPGLAKAAEKLLIAAPGKNIRPVIQDSNSMTMLNPVQISNARPFSAVNSTAKLFKMTAGITNVTPAEKPDPCCRPG